MFDWTPSDGGSLRGMETATEVGPALFAGGVCVLFGLLLLVWTTSRVWRGEPVVEVERPVIVSTFTAGCGVAFLGLGLWWLLSV